MFSIGHKKAPRLADQVERTRDDDHFTSFFQRLRQAPGEVESMSHRLGRSTLNYQLLSGSQKILHRRRPEAMNGRENYLFKQGKQDLRQFSQRLVAKAAEDQHP